MHNAKILTDTIEALSSSWEELSLIYDLQELYPQMEKGREASFLKSLLDKTLHIFRSKHGVLILLDNGEKAKLQVSCGEPTFPVRNLKQLLRTALRFPKDLSLSSGILSIPISVNGTLKGVIALAGFPTGKELSISDVKLLGTITNYIALVVDDRMLSQRIRDKDRILELLTEKVIGDSQKLVSLHEISEKMSSLEHDLEEICRSILDEIWKALHFAAGLIARVTQKRRLFPIASKGIENAHLNAVMEFISDKYYEHVIKEGKTIVRNPPEKAIVIGNSLLIQSMLIVPLKSVGEIHGLIAICNKDESMEFTTEDLKIIETIANYLAGCITCYR